MNIDLASAMRRALEHTRAQNLNEATAVIQAALAGHCPSRERPGSAGISSSPASRAPFSLLDLDADTVEPAAAIGPECARKHDPFGRQSSAPGETSAAKLDRSGGELCQREE